MRPNPLADIFTYIDGDDNRLATAAGVPISGSLVSGILYSRHCRPADNRPR